MPFDLDLFLRMLRTALREPMSPRRRRVVWLAALLLPPLALLNAVCFALDPLFFPGFRRVEIRAPVFIVGHARSGTSLLHRLMCADRERFSWFALYEMFLPSLLQRKLVRALARWDERFFSSALARRIAAWEDRAFAKGRQMHPMSLTGPEEDEFLLAVPFSSGTVSMLFPYLRELLPYARFDTDLPERKRRRVMRFYRECVRRQLWLNGAHKTHLAKNPVFSDKVATLVEFFPDARFVVTLRSPYQTIPSLQKMMRRNWKASDVREERIRDSLAVLFENSVHHYLHPFEVLDARPGTTWTTVRYEDLLEKPRETLLALYRALGLPVSAQLEQSLLEEESRAREYRAEHLYSLAEFGLQAGEIRRRLAPLVERFGWPEPEPAGHRAAPAAEGRATCST